MKLVTFHLHLKLERIFVKILAISFVMQGHVVFSLSRAVVYGHVGHMPFPMSIAHRKWIFYLSLFKLFWFIYKKSDIFIRTDMLATCRMPCPFHNASEYFIYTYLNYFDFLYKHCDTFIRTDMLVTCRITCPLRTANETFIYTFLTLFCCASKVLGITTLDSYIILKSGTVCIEPSTGVSSLRDLSKEHLQ